MTPECDETTPCSIPLFPKERHDLLEAISHQVQPRTNGHSRDVPRGLLLVSGASGTGKSYLVRSVKQTFCEKYHGIFWDGKVDQIQHSNPFVQIFSELGDLVADEEIDQLRQMITTEFGLDDLAVLYQLIPSLEEAFSFHEAREVSKADDFISAIDKGGTMELTGSRHKERMPFILCHIARLICRLRPLLIFIDDLQWAKQSTFNTLTEMLSTEIEQGSLIVVAACREVPTCHALSSYLRSLDVKGIAIEEIVLSNLTLREVNQHLGMILHATELETKSLAEILHIYTGGNNFFMRQVISQLKDEQLLFRARDAHHDEWDWDMFRIRQRLKFPDVHSFVREKLLNLPSESQTLLKIAACLGATFEYVFLKTSLPQYIQPRMEDLLLDLQDKHVLIRNSKSKRNDCSWSFLHDQIQEEAYGLMDQSRQSIVHLAVGKRLLQGLPLHHLEANVLFIGSQVMSGIEKISDCPKERYHIAMLFLQSGRRAGSASQFEDASHFFDVAIQLLPKDHWRNHYDFSLDLFNAAAEVEYVRGNLERLDLLTEECLSNARSFDDKLQSYTTKIYAMGSQNQLEEAIEETLYVLGELGEPLPKEVSNYQLNLEYWQTRRMITRLSERGYMSLPPMKDPRKLAAMRLIVIVTSYTFWLNSSIMKLAPLRLVKLSIKHGLSGMAAVGLSLFGCLASMFGDLPHGFRMGQLALKVVERFNAREWKSRVMTLVAANVNSFTKRVSDIDEPLRVASRLGLDTGDIEFAMLSAGLRTVQNFEVCNSLPNLVAKFRRLLVQMEHYKQIATFNMFAPTAQAFANMIGKGASNPWELVGEFFDERYSGHERRNANKRILGINHLMKSYIAFTMGRPDLAATYMNFLVASINISETMHPAFVMLQGCLICLINLRLHRPKVRKAKRFLKFIRRLAVFAPSVHLAKVHLVEGELALRKGAYNRALSKFVRAKAISDNENMVCVHALACESISRVMEQQGRPKEALAALRQARTLYNDWGYGTKVSQLDRVFPFLGQGTT